MTSAISHFAMVVVPTTNMLYMLTILTKYNFREVVKYIIGIAIANAFYVIITIYGLNKFSNLSKNTQIILYLIALFIIFFFGLRIMLNAKKFIQLNQKEKEIELKKEHFTIQGFVLTLINPKAMLLYPITLAPLLMQNLTELEKVFLVSWFGIMTPIYVFITMYLINKFVAIGKIHSFLFKIQRWFGALLILVATGFAVYALMKHFGIVKFNILPIFHITNLANR